MKLGIVGSRRRARLEDLQILRERVKQLQPSMIISGGCPTGADAFAEQIAKELGIPITIYYPKLMGGRSYPPHIVREAMFARNQLIALEAEALIALVAEDRKGGTENTIGHFKGAKPFTWQDCLELL